MIFTAVLGKRNSLLYHSFVPKEFWRVHEKFDAERRKTGRYVDLKCMRATGHPEMETRGRVFGAVGQEDAMVSVLYWKTMSSLFIAIALVEFRPNWAHILF